MKCMKKKPKKLKEYQKNYCEDNKSKKPKFDKKFNLIKNLIIHHKLLILVIFFFISLCTALTQ